MCNNQGFNVAFPIIGRAISVCQCSLQHPAIDDQTKYPTSSCHALPVGNHTGASSAQEMQADWSAQVRAREREPAPEIFCVSSIRLA